ncbi:MAG: M20/M25/M40 family metallo-hydrolase [Candidatus Cloacimonetes bacterium]|nr:M20/M25/M40 family metallo-hydrolase [Candidatus Cloacimonadota bacterium]
MAITLEDVTSVLSELVSIPSVNPHLSDHPDAGETAIAEHIVGWCASRGIEAWTEEAAPGRPNAIARIGSGSPVLIFCAHIDTVATDGMTIEPFTPDVADGKLYGRGAYDMKAGAAAIMCALDALARDPAPGTVIGAFVCDEEWASAGAYHFVERYGGDACVVTEPSEGRLVLAHKGFVWLELTTHGVAAHGSRWDLGDSAIARMARIVSALDDHDQRTLRERTHPLLGPASMHVSQIQGGSGISTYAAECTARVERRTLPGETPEQVLREIEDVVAGTGESADIRILMDRPPLVCDRDAPIARAVRDAAREMTGSDPEECGVGYWMDAAVFANAGIQTVNIGAGGAGAHGAEEWVDLESVVVNARILERTARRFTLE